MRPIAPTLLAAATLLSLLHVPAEQRPTAPDPQDRTSGGLLRRAGPRRPAPELDRRLQEIQGAWELSSIEDPALEDPSIRTSGMMLVSDGFLSFELHIGLVEPDADLLLRSYFQSGVHRVEVDSLGQLVLESVLGAELDREGFFSYEKPGQRRLYRFDLAAEGLVLTRIDRRGRFIFRRVQHRPARLDIFGRPVEPEPPPGDDQR